ncbi:leucine-rich repeat-containing protein 14 [Eudromia elegans]
MRSLAFLRQRLQLLDVTGLPEEGPGSGGPWATTVALAKACVEAAARGGPAAAAPVVELRADLFVNGTSAPLLREALRSGARGALRLRCRVLRAEELSAAGAAALLELLEPAGVRRVELRFNNLGLAGLAHVLPRLARFADLVSLRLPYSNVDVRRLPPGADLGALAAQLGALAPLRELNLGSSRLSGNLRLLLGHLRAPLESLELAFCALLPCDLSYLAQSPHAPALKKLDLSGHNLSGPLLPPFQALLAAAAASLLHLDVMECRVGDAQLDALLAPLARCARLRYLGLFGNPLSTAALRALLLRTAPLPELRLVVYPYPTDCLADGAADDERLSRADAELRELLHRAGRADAVWTTSLSAHGAPECIDL